MMLNPVVRIVEFLLAAAACGMLVLCLILLMLGIIGLCERIAAWVQSVGKETDD